jgi:DNA polymerase (family X)
MSNKEIANAFDELANLMELHEEPIFKIRSYQNAYITLRKIDRPVAEMTDAERKEIKGVGDAISLKIKELATGGKMATLEKYRSMTPPGVVEMLQIKGFGPKKIKQLWKDLAVETPGELLYACNENRLVELKGFGEKTQEDLRKKLEFFLRSRDKFHYSTLEIEADFLLPALVGRLPDARISLVGEMRRRCPIVSKFEILIASDADFSEKIFDGELLILEKQDGEKWLGKLPDSETPVTIYRCELADFGSKLFKYSAAPDFLAAFLKEKEGADFKNLSEEIQIFERVGLPFIEPELREFASILPLAKANNLPQLIENQQVRGVLHAHSTYSDGIATLREMAIATRDLGYEYLGITDHSQAAFYANGLKPDRVLAQMTEIDALNIELAPFRIFKGIESDILNDGSLDYEADLLEKFDFIIASVHSNLKMDIEKATNRLLRAIENPFTTILGHPTGRILLAREGYPIDHKKIIEACAKNGVCIELNANPYRLDLDWTWINYATERGVKISINPDAHSKNGLRDVHFGVLAARKGGLTADFCLNSMNLTDFESFLKNRKNR